MKHVSVERQTRVKSVRVCLQFDCAVFAVVSFCRISRMFYQLDAVNEVILTE